MASPSRISAAHIAASLLVAAACAAANPQSAQPPLPDEAAVQDMMNQRTGAVPLREAPVTTDGVQVVFQTGHAFGMTAVALSRDGRYILSGAQDETAKLWDVASGQEVRTLTGFDSGGPRSVAFSADGARMIVADTRGIAIIDTASGQNLRTLHSLSFNPAPLVSGDGRTGVDGGGLGAARSPRLIDLATGRVLWTLPDEGLGESAVALSRDGETLLTRLVGRTRPGPFSRKPSELSYELHVWDVSARKLRSKLPIESDGADSGNAMLLSPDGRQLLAETRNRSLSLIDLATSKEILILPTGAAAASSVTTTLLYSSDGTKIAFATADGHAKIWELPSGREIASLAASAVNFSADGTTVVLGHDTGGAPSLHELGSGKETSLAGGAQAVIDLAVVGDGHAVAAAMTGGGVKLWDLGTAQMIRSFYCPSGYAASSVAASNAAPLLAVGCLDGSASLWNLTSGEKIRDLLASQAGALNVTVARFSRDGRVLAVAVRDMVTVFDPDTGQQLRQLKLPASAAPAIASSSALMNSQMFGQMPPSVRKKFEEQEAVRQKSAAGAATEQSRDDIRSIAFAPDGRLIAIGRMREISLWDADTGRLVRRIGGAAALAAPEQQTMAAGTPDSATMQKFMSQMQSGKGMPGGGGAPVMIMTNPMAVFSAIKQQFDGAVSLAFSPDGRMLLSVGSQGKRLWDVATGQQIRSGGAPPFDPRNPQAMLGAVLGDEIGEAGGTAFSPDGRFAAHGIGRIVKITDVASGNDVAQLVGHTSNVAALAFLDGGRLLVSGGRDGAVRLWTMPDGKEAAALMALGRSDYVAVTPDQYYRASKSRIKGVAFRVKDQLYPFEQFDLRFNRPDIVLRRIGLADPQTVQSYAHAYERRLAKMGFNEAMLGTDFHLPEVAILTRDVPVTTADAALKLQVRATDDKYPLDRLNLFVNDVPVYGSAGLPFAAKGVHQAEQAVTVPLASGRNKVQVSVLNAQGSESLKQTVYTTSTADQGPGDIYVVAIGVSEYKNKAYNLRYAAKDAGDFLSAYQSVGERPGPRGVVHVLDVTNSHATRDGIREAKQFLQHARVNDLAVVFAAGHGMTDEKQNYYFGTWDIDPAHPAVSGLPYEDFESLLDGIPALQKVLLIDTCFSGEIDKEEATVVAQANAGDGTVKMRAFKAERGIQVVADGGMSASSQAAAVLARVQQDWFADLRRGTGAVVISSASGNEYALEGEQWHNGVFTYALLNGLKNRAADLNGDGIITVGELQSYVIEQVRKLTEGGQNPTVRRENLDYDFAVF